MRKWWHYAAVAAGAIACKASMAQADLMTALRNTAHAGVVRQLAVVDDLCFLHSGLADAYYLDIPVVEEEQQTGSSEQEEYYIDELGFCNDPSCPCHDSVIESDLSSQDYAADDPGVDTIEQEGEEAELLDRERLTGNDLAEELNSESADRLFGWDQANNEEEWIHQNLINDPYPERIDEESQADPARSEGDEQEPTWLDYGEIDEAGTQTDLAEEDEYWWFDEYEQRMLDAEEEAERELQEAYGEEPYLDPAQDSDTLTQEAVDAYLEQGFDGDAWDATDSWDQTYEDEWYDAYEGEAESFLYDDRVGSEDADAPLDGHGVEDGLDEMVEDEAGYDPYYYDDFYYGMDDETAEVDGQDDATMDEPSDFYYGETSDLYQSDIDYDPFTMDAYEQAPAANPQDEALSEDGQDDLYDAEDWYLYDYEYEGDRERDENVEQANVVEMLRRLGDGIRLSSLLYEAARAVEQIETAMQNLPVERVLANMADPEEELEALLNDGQGMICPYCQQRADGELEN